MLSFDSQKPSSYNTFLDNKDSKPSGKITNNEEKNLINLMLDNINNDKNETLGKREESKVTERIQTIMPTIEEHEETKEFNPMLKVFMSGNPSTGEIKRTVKEVLNVSNEDADNNTNKINKYKINYSSKANASFKIKNPKKIKKLRRKSSEIKLIAKPICDTETANNKNEVLVEA